MKIETAPAVLSISSSIHFDEKQAFYIQPYMVLYAYKEPYGHWETGTICIAVKDYDDFDTGMVYQAGPEQFSGVLHELANWMADHEKGITPYHGLYHDPHAFFPDCGCMRRRW